jgi:hypothetical protein
MYPTDIAFTVIEGSFQGPNRVLYRFDNSELILLDHLEIPRLKFIISRDSRVLTRAC